MEEKRNNRALGLVLRAAEARDHPALEVWRRVSPPRRGCRCTWGIKPSHGHQEPLRLGWTLRAVRKEVRCGRSALVTEVCGADRWRFGFEPLAQARFTHAED
ncbi:unnamed protein product [Pleuronectes platessa]|uniref:Uncharacterized protein n=1 Tax=Pleuronectes platessa TaxID=8262 RepID=A0A9N7UAS4_PLEPL|nr:unnamed protein product [Pleuronectes platessa]